MLGQNPSQVTWYFTLGLMIVTAIVGIPYAIRVWRDVNGESDECSVDPSDVLGPLTDAYAAGELSREEYERIRRSLEAPKSLLDPAASSTPEPEPDAATEASASPALEDQAALEGGEQERGPD